MLGPKIWMVGGQYSFRHFHQITKEIRIVYMYPLIRAEAVRTAVYIQNRIGDKVSAHELYFGTKPNLRHLMVFGSIA